MGLIRAFFRPLTDFVKFYKDMTQGTAEEIAARESVIRNAELLERESKSIRELAEAQEVKFYQSFTKALKDVNASHNAIAAQTELIDQLNLDLIDPDSDKEEVFQRMQKLGIELTPEGLVFSKLDHLDQELPDFSKIQSGADFALLSQRMSDLKSKLHAADSNLNEFADIVGANDLAGDLNAADEEFTPKGSGAQKMAEQIKRGQSNSL